MDKPIEKFYSDAEVYWAKIPPTVDGMLGGFGYISPIDIQGSKVFLQQLFRSKKPPGRTYAVDCGAGIGRISKNLLLNFFQKVDLVEQNPSFLDKAKAHIGPKLLPKVGNLFPIGLQEFIPEPNKYDVIWVQWVLGHLTDVHLLRFLDNCKKGLKPSGMIIIKENTTSSGEVEVDEQDSSVTRPLPLLRKLFDKAGLDCYRQLKQNSFPKELYNVYMFALKPGAVMCAPEFIIDTLNISVKPLEEQNTEEVQIDTNERNNGNEAAFEFNNLENEINVPDAEQLVVSV